MTGQRGFAERNATEREQAPGCERGASRGTKERTPADPAGICGATFEQSENGVASTLPPAGATTGQRGFAAGEMRPNGSKGRGESGSRVWEKREAPRCRGDDYEICRWRYFLSVKKVTKERRVFAVGAPARRSRDGNGKIAVRGGEAMAAKRTAAEGVRSEMPRPILRGKPKRRGR